MSINTLGIWNISARSTQRFAKTTLYAAASRLVHLKTATFALAVATVFGFSFCSTTAKAALVAYYSLNGTLNDSSGNGNTGTGGSDLNYAVGGGIVSDGADTQEYFTSPVNINPLNQVTFGGWFETTSTNPRRALITNDSGGFGRGINIDDRNVTPGDYAAFAGGPGPFGGAAPTGNFDFVAVTYDRAANTQTLDVNGQFFTSTGSAAPTGDNFLTIGKSSHFDMPFGGTIKDVFIFDTALTQAQLNSIEANGVQVPEPTSLVAIAGLCGMGFVGLAIRRRRRG